MSKFDLLTDSIKVSWQPGLNKYTLLCYQCGNREEGPAIISTTELDPNLGYLIGQAEKHFKRYHDDA